MSHASKYILIKTEFTSQLYLVPGLRMSGVIPPLRPYDFYFKRELYAEYWRLFDELLG